MARKKNYSFINKTKGKLPRLPFVHIKDAILGPDYDLSFVFVGDEESKQLNTEHRKKDYVPDVLSFSLGENAGEIIMNPFETARQAPLYERSYSNFVGFLFIHALCHLKGMDHGSRMERTEAEFRKEFNI